MSFFLETNLTYAYGNIFKCLQLKYVPASEASRIFLYFLEFLVQNNPTKKQREKRKYVPAKPDMWRKASMSFFLETKLTYAYGNILLCLQLKYVSASEASRIFLYFLEFLVQHYITKKQREKKKYVPAKPDMWRNAPMSFFLETHMPTATYLNVFN